MKIWAPICSAIVFPFSALDPLAGAWTPLLQAQEGGVLGGNARARPTTGTVRRSIR